VNACFLKISANFWTQIPSNFGKVIYRLAFLGAFFYWSFFCLSLLLFSTGSGFFLMELFFFLRLLLFSEVAFAFSL